MSGVAHKGIRMSAITTDAKIDHLAWTEFRKYEVHMPERDLVGRNVWWLMEPEQRRIKEWTEARLASKSQTGTP